MVFLNLRQEREEEHDRVVMVVLAVLELDLMAEEAEEGVSSDGELVSWVLLDVSLLLSRLVRSYIDTQGLCGSEGREGRDLCCSYSRRLFGSSCICVSEFRNEQRKLGLSLKSELRLQDQEKVMGKKKRE